MLKKIKNPLWENSSYESLLEFGNVILRGLRPDSIQFEYDYGKNHDKIHIIKSTKRGPMVWVDLGDGFSWEKKSDLIREELDLYAHTPFDELMEAYKECLKTMK